MRVRPLPVRSWRNFGDLARETGQRRVPAPPAGTTAQNRSRSADEIMGGTLPGRPSGHLMLTGGPPGGHRETAWGGDDGAVRVAIATESFLPSLNGVTTSVCRVAESLREQGHTAMIIAPGPAPATFAGHVVRPLPGVPVRGFRAGLPTRGVRQALRDFRPDVLHAASPFLVGAHGLRSAESVDLPTVAIYQTDMPNYVRQHGPGALGRGASSLTWEWIRRIHSRADLTLAPSHPTLEELRAH